VDGRCLIPWTARTITTATPPPRADDEPVQVGQADVRASENGNDTPRMVLPNSRALAAVMRQWSLTQLAADFAIADPHCGALRPDE
jgi:hypothetical protein